ncbi:MAG TPA: LysR family transcriptional regulator, partial [Reyranella sp.]|nr:LysR family transcriptional regulator [Reyranella sp.]
MRQHLDLAAVEAFVLVAELHSFTLASDALGMTQAGVSLKLRRLEEMMGRRLLDRTPRHVRLSSEGEAFLPHAQDLLAAQQSALALMREPGRELSIAISDHVAGPELPEILARVNAHDPGLLLKVRVDFSSKVRKDFENGDLDVAIIRQGARRDGDLLFEDPYGWFASVSANFVG